ncbi:MAG: hypothetical protein WCO57_04665 [Verrucomicrobiota bacterium]
MSDHNPASSLTQTVAQILAENGTVSSKLKGELFSRALEVTSGRKNVFNQMTSAVNPQTAVGGGVRSIFASKTDLKAGGADTVNFNIIGPPAGPGAQGAGVLVGHTSRSRMGTYPVRVGWKRDAVTFTKDQIEMLSAGRSLVETQITLLGEKMGMLKENEMKMRLIKTAQKAGSRNIYRPGNAATTNGLKATDTLSLAIANNVKARMNVTGAKPIAHRLGNNGTPLNGFLIFASDQAMLPIVNDDGFQAAQAMAGVRGDANALFTGDMTKWGGMEWFTQPGCDEAWDDYIGNPMTPKARIAKDVTEGTSQFDGASLEAAGILKGHSTNPVGARFFQFFNGYDYLFTEDQTAAPDSTEYYAWAINPNGTVCFLSYTGTGNVGTTITVKDVLSTAAANGTLGATTVGRLCYGTGGSVGVATTTRIITTGAADVTVPASGGDWVYVDRVDAGAILLQATRDGVQIGRSFGFGAMAACFAYGRIEKASIEQVFDYGFEIGRGFEMIFGTGVTTDPYGNPVGYQLIEHAIETEGYPTPSYSL